jgi:hypothetical protein
MREIRRRTRVVGAFPDGQSCLNLAAARLRYIVGTGWSTKCYMNVRSLYQPQLMQTEAVAWSNVRKILDTTLQDGAGGDCFEAPGIALQVGTLVGLAQVQEPGGACSQA